VYSVPFWIEFEAEERKLLDHSYGCITQDGDRIATVAPTDEELIIMCKTLAVLR
jgi:hypothetical protein